MLFGAKKTGDGMDYYTGVINDLRGEIQIVVFRNDKKENENQPDYDILLSESKKGEQNNRERFANPAVGGFREAGALLSDISSEAQS